MELRFWRRRRQIDMQDMLVPQLGVSDPLQLGELRLVLGEVFLRLFALLHALLVVLGKLLVDCVDGQSGDVQILGLCLQHSLVAIHLL